MNYSIFRIHLDLHNTESQVHIRLNRGDTARKFVFYFTEDGTAYGLDGVEGCLFNATKPGNSAIIHECEIYKDNNVIEYIVDEQVTAIEGTWQCQLSMTDGNGHSISTPKFQLEIGENVVDGMDLQSQSDFQALIEAYNGFIESKATLDSIVDKLPSDIENSDLASKSDVDRKLDKPTIPSSTRVVTFETDGTTGTINFSQNVLANSLVETDENGFINPKTPKNDTNAATKGYVDESISTLEESIRTIDGKIPSDASSDNLLATESYVDENAITDYVKSVSKSGNTITFTYGNGNTSTYTPTVGSSGVSQSYVDTAVGNVASSVSAINAKIPSAASATNQLADKAFVNDSISEMAARYVTSTAQGASFASESALKSATATYYYNGQAYSPTVNDYAVVSNYNNTGMPARFLFTGDQWAFQYQFSNLQLSDSQMSAINSGITASGLSSIDSSISSIEGSIGSIETDVMRLGEKGHINSASVSGNTLTINYDAPNGGGTQSVSFTPTSSGGGIELPATTGFTALEERILSVNINKVLSYRKMVAFPKTGGSEGGIAIYGANGVLRSQTPSDDTDVANKAYVDTEIASVNASIGDVETALSELLGAGGYSITVISSSSSEDEIDVFASDVDVVEIGTVSPGSQQTFSNVTGLYLKSRYYSTIRDIVCTGGVALDGLAEEKSEGSIIATGDGTITLRTRM